MSVRIKMCSVLIILNNSLIYIVTGYMGEYVKTYCVEYAPIGSGNAPKITEVINTSKMIHGDQIAEILLELKERLKVSGLDFADIIIYRVDVMGN